MKPSVACIGAGPIGRGIAHLSSVAGWRVFISNSRGPESLEALVSDLGPGVSARTAEAAVADADLVVLSVPFGRFPSLAPGLLTGKVVIDTMNYAPGRDGPMAEVDDAGLVTSPLVQSHFDGAQIVKALHNLDYIRLVTAARPRGVVDRVALPVAGDHAAANALVATFLDEIGYDSVDVGSLSESWRCGPGSPVYCKAYVGDPPDEFDDEQAKEWFKTAPAITITADRLRSLVGEATRHPQMYAGAHLNPRGMRAAQLEAGMVKRRPSDT